MKNKHKKATTFIRNVIVVSNEKERKALIEASSYLHDLKEIDTDIPIVNWLCHIYQNPCESIIVLKNTL